MGKCLQNRHTPVNDSFAVGNTLEHSPSPTDFAVVLVPRKSVGKNLERVPNHSPTTIDAQRLGLTKNNATNLTADFAEFSLMS
jgi:hypothetical protein